MSVELSRILKMPFCLEILAHLQSHCGTIWMQHGVQFRVLQGAVFAPCEGRSNTKTWKTCIFDDFLECKISCDTCKHANIPFPCMPFQGPECRKSMHSSKQSLVCKSTSFWEYGSGSQLEVIHPIALKKAERLNGKRHTQTAPSWFQKVSDDLGMFT